MAINDDVLFASDLMQEYDIESKHSIRVEAPIHRVYAKARTLNMSDSRTIRALFRLRGLPPSALTADGMRRLGFKPLREESPHGFALGIIGQFWTLSGHLVDFEPAGFPTFREPGFAKALWSFDLRETADGTNLRTMTRVQTLDRRSHRRFRRYWRVVGPFSGMIRTSLLRMVRDAAEEGS